MEPNRLGDESHSNVVGGGRAPTQPTHEPKAPPVVRDALLGGSILGVALAGLGLVAIVTAPDYGIESLRSPIGYVLLGLAVILGVSAVRGGRRGRYSAGVVSVALGGLLIAGYGLPLAAFAAPFFVSAYLLLRSNRAIRS